MFIVSAFNSSSIDQVNPSQPHVSLQFFQGAARGMSAGFFNHCKDVCWRSMFAVGMAPAWHMPTANISDPDRGIAVSFQVVPPCDSPLRIAKFSKPAAPPTTGKFRGRRAILALRLAPGKLLLQASLCSTLRLSCQGATAAQL